MSSSRKAVPMVCLVCKHTPGAYYGRLVFPEETEQPTCPNHADKALSYPLTTAQSPNKGVSVS